MLLRMDTLKTGMPRILWLCILVTLLVLVIYSESAESKKVDSDLIFDNLDKTNSISKNRPHHVVKRTNHPSSHVENHWLYTTLSRLKRSISELMGEKKTVSKHTKQKRKRRQQQDSKTGLDSNGNDIFDEDGENPDEGEEDDFDDEYKDEDEGPDDGDEDYEDDIYESTTTGANGGITEIGVDETTTPKKQFTTSFPTNYDDEDDIDNDDNSSGDGEIPVTAATPKDSEVKRYYRITITVREPFTEEFNDRNSYKYREFADQIKEAVENVYEGTPGINSLSVIGIYKRHKDSFTSRVVLDLGINSSPVDDDALRNTLLDHISRARRLGNYEALENDFSFVKFDAPIRTCEEYEIPCKTGACVNATSICDGFVDCSDGSDEDGCPKSSDSDCTSGEFSCDLTRCILARKRCDGILDCDDQTDERECTTCSGDAVLCDANKCIRANQKCDGVVDCTDGTDEENCIPVSSCIPGQFQCQDGSCINDHQRCDRRRDCPNGEDEFNCAAGCNADQFACGDGKCIPLAAKCNRKYDCRDQSDEKSCPCHPDDFHCGNGYCIPADQRCNGLHNCQDGSDEMNCDNYKPCQSTEWRCADGTCISRSSRCNFVRDCPNDNSDERDCNLCQLDQFRCGNGSCISLSQRCDGKIDCPSGEDEDSCARCTENEFDCGNGDCIPDDRVCDSRRDCPDGKDEYDCPPPRRCQPSEFTCDDGTCIPGHLQCNGRAECRDRSDEADCPCTQNQFPCLDGDCIDGSLRCNKYIDCRDGSDEINCPTESPPRPTESTTTTRPRCPSGSYQCRSGQCIPATKICDGPADCLDMSDELDCAGTSMDLHLRTYPDAQDIKENREVVFQCRDEGPMRASVQWTRPNGLPLPPGSRDNKGRLEIPNIKVEHAGEYICEARGFPPNAPNAQVRVRLNVEKWTPSLPPRSRTACAPNQATCSNGDCIPKDAVCDGRKDCTDGSDESRCRVNGCEPNEYSCANRECILKTWRCDGIHDCADGSDEADCVSSSQGSSTSMCLSHHFTCHAQNQCIPKSYHCDLERDCNDGSDEIGCAKPVIRQPPPPMVKIAIGEIFEIECAAVGVPVPEINWRRNWGHIPQKCRTTSVDGVGILTCPDIQPEDQGSYSCESINSKGITFAVHDTILTVTTENICRPGYFNNEARTESECIKCFCFGHGGNCRSADLFIYHYQPPFDSLNVVGVRVDPITRTVEIRDEPIYRNSPEITPVGLHGIHTSLQSSAELTQPNLVPYFSMPESYHENQLKSYGGYLRYKVHHNNRGYSVPGPDVILSGNGYVLLHQSRQQPESFRDESRAVRFFEGEWVKKTDDGSERAATREDIMMTLANINNILIKLQYNEGPLNTTISEIVMESAATPDNNLGAASYVEECTCPVGYTGLSCERCDEGYERHNNGPWLGQCYKTSRTCPTGMYGDPDRGIECQTCPCPLTNPQNQFGTSCSLAPDGDVRCDCPLGYIGRRCEQCASGYEGNPMVPGDSCRPRSQELCSKAGSKSLSPIDGRCDCKDNVEGPTCSQCKANSFDLSVDNQYGCVSCFCMGVTSKCGSSAWYRDQISTSFASSTNDFSIVDIDDRENLISDGIRLDQGSRQILYSSFPSQNIFYWSLPPRYLGNKLTAYGGYLRYTLKYVPLPGGQSSRNSAADVQLISANHIDLLYYAKEQSLPTNSAQTFVVPLLEQYWQRTDGQQADREHLLMALSDLKSILIKATYTTNTKEAALISVSLDTANVRNTGSLERASAVEHCYCPEGYKGLSCEDCAFGYTRGSGGLYLGICEPCSCNGHSNECDPERGECLNCRDHTTGRFCDKCLPGYEGDPTNGIPCRYREGSSCQCDPRGSISNECYNGVCACKQNVVGNLCDRCRQGTFGLNSSDIDGCQSCFCSGVATECSESSLYIEQIPTQILDEESHGFSLTDQNLRNRISDNFEFNYGINEITYRLRPDDSGLYWSVPQILTGNQIKSYGGKLEFRQKYTEYSRGRPIPDKDVIIIGDKLSIYWTNPNPLIPNVQNKLSIPISISNGWQRLDQTAGQRPASREDILIALSNIREILIRAKPTDTTDSSSLSDVTLETAIEAYSTEGKATSVEVCRCPIGYEGTSCESCVLGYYRDINDISAGPLGSCTKCPCSQNANGCSMGPDNTVVCQCVPGYSGSRCEYYGDNNSTDNTSDNNNNGRPVTINVTITAPTIKIFEIGSTLRLNCSAVSIQGPSSITWKKDGGLLPETAINDGRGLLIITNLKVSDSGKYICEAEDGYSIATKDVTVVVGTSQNNPPRVVVNPPFVDVKEGQRIEVKCAASGTPAPRYMLQRADSQPLSRQYSFDNGIFIIDQAALSDRGKYNCIAENIYGTDTTTFEVFVAVADFVRVSIEPPSVTTSSGETFSLRCLSQSQSRDVQWSKQNGDLPYNSRIDRNGILTVTDATAQDSGVYICTISSPSGAVGRGSALVEISESGEFPSVDVSPKSVTISRGSSTSIRCDVSGSPPPTIKWTKVNQSLTQHTQQIGSTLYIRNADERDEGTYVCVATNTKGLNQAHADVFVRRTSAPVIRIYPNSTQNVIEGHTLDLECVSEGGYPSRITWTRSSGLPLSRNVEQYDQGRIRFNAITKDAEGIYICSAENEAGVTTASAVIYVQTRPEIRIVPDEETIYRREGSSLSLECYATGSPEPSVSWTKYPSYSNSQTPRQFRPPSSNYAIEQFNRLTKDDEGLYSCQALSSIGNVQKQVRLIVDTLPERGDMTGEDAASENNNGFKDLDRPRNPNDINRYTVPVGTRAELHCSISTSNNGFDSVDTTWERADNAPLPENAFVRGGTLFVDNAQEAARGYYRCLATKRSNGQLIFTLDAYLDVIALPNITLVPDRQVVRPGDNAYVQCIASGQQPITITWSPIRREFPASVSISDGLLKFNNIQPSDAGRYRCTAVNSVGEADAVADVLVQETRYTPSIHAVTKAHEASAGSSVTLQCQTENGTNNEIRWYKENMSLPKNAHITADKNLQIDNVQLSNEGRYFCEIRTNSGRRTDFVDLRITGPLSEANLVQPALFISPSERDYRIGEHVDVNCQSNQPGAITTWSKPSGWLDDNVQSIGGTLRISKLRRENAGVYRCEATGYQGVYHKDYNLKIIEDNSMLQAAVETKIAPKGSSIVLDCGTTLEGPTSYVWTKAVGELPGYIDPYTRTIQLNDLTSSDAGAYMCTAKTANRKVEVPIILVITGIVPYFSQAPVSFIALPTLMNSYTRFNFEISFKPEREDGLILYNGNKQNERGADFISLALVGGIPEFRYNLGYSVTIVRSKPISIGQWHTVKVIRNRKKVTMYVDDEGPYTVTADGKLIGLELSENLYIGGVPRFDNISPEVEIDTGFVGCISRFKMSHSVQDILRDAIDKEGITNCETCSENRCRNKGVCQESLSNEGYICICHSGFSGPTCSKRKQESCSPYSCGSGRCVDTDESFECMCPIGKGGSRCERDVHINEPAFQNDAYIAYDVSKQRKLRYSMKFKPNSTKDGILLYCGETEKDHGDFASLTLKDQHVEFRFDVGNGPTVVRSPRKINPGEWVAVTASRIKSEGRLIVNGEAPAIERSLGNNKTPNLLTYIYVGGVNKQKIKVNEGVGVESGFDGCITDINIDDKKVDMIQSAVESSNIQDCSSVYNNNDIGNNIDSQSSPTPYNHYQTGCSSNPCRNDGICDPLSPTTYQCNCVNGYSGRDCEISPNQCDFLKPCQNNGLCKGNTTYYHCDCPLGFTGTNCEQRSKLRTDAHFDGNGYLEFDKEMLPHMNNKEEVIALELSTNSSFGLIFWHGQSPNQDAQGKDYLALALVNGYLEFTYDLGSGPAIIYDNNVRINDGERHLVILKRQGKVGSLEVDRQYTQKDESVGSASTLTCNGNIYLGGAPNISYMTADRYNDGFVGCIHVFELQGYNQIDLGSKAISGLNVKPCSSYEGIYSFDSEQVV